MRHIYIEKDFNYRGYDCCVTLMDMGHRCGYVKLPKHNQVPLKKIKDEIWVHGGITYAERGLHYHWGDDFWIGWDYAHPTDKKDFEAIKKHFKAETKEDELSLEMLLEFAEMHNKMFEDSVFPHRISTTDDVIKECKDVVDQLIGITKRQRNERRLLKSR